jgi:hypothetical protein
MVGAVSNWDAWYSRFDAADGTGRLSLLRALIESDHSKAAFEEMDLPEAVLALGAAIAARTPKAYFDFLSDLRQRRPDVFELEAVWYVREMVYAALAAGAHQRMDWVVAPLLEVPHLNADVTADVLDVLMLSGCSQAAAALTLAACRRLAEADLMPWAEHELLDRRHACSLIADIEAGLDLSEPALGKLLESLTRDGFEGDVRTVREILGHLSGTVPGSWHQRDLLVTAGTGRQPYLITLDFASHLVRGKGLTFIAAEALRGFVGLYFQATAEKADKQIFVLSPHRLADYISGLCGMASLQQTRAVATVRGLVAFWEYLAAHDLIPRDTAIAASRQFSETRRQLDDAYGEQFWPRAPMPL